MLLIAIASGAIFAVIILIILISLIRHKKKVVPKIENDEKVTKIIETPSGNFTLTTSPPSSPNSSLSKSNLMFRYFGRSLSSFDVEKSYINSDCIAINIELDNSKQIYRKQILMPHSIIDERDCCKENYIQTITC